ncbi:MAG: catechol 2,3-dioxygenase-like lactoylglutathione lyase family enzyme [Halioglobus sp.]|jgi:catechol 2,3-dioxygenase-like lactoylglutathione lyase family enzyme
MQSFWGTNLSLRLPRFGYRSVRFMVFTLLCLTQACASQQTDSGGYKSASIELNEAFRVGSTTKFDSDDDIGLVGRYHFATHTRDFDKARAFYRKLGYTEGVSGFPLTNTHQMARALGMFDVCQYELVKGEVISLPGSLNAAGIDLLQFKTPFNGEPPYELPNHLGMAYAALLTTDLAADVAYLKSLNVDLLSEPFGIPGDRFVFFRDPEGVLYKLMETAPPHGDPNSNMHLIAMPYIGINVSNFDESLAFYKRLGYTNIKWLPESGSVEEAKAYGLEGPFKIKGADISLGRGDNHVLRLVQWISHFNPEQAYPPPINHIGINRIALVVPDVDRAVAILKRQGTEFLSEVAPCCSGTGDDERGIVHMMDPDGVFLELIGPIAKRPLPPPPDGCPALTIKMPPKVEPKL